MATLKDIAESCGVSTATVSYVLNNGPRPVMEKTRERVLKAIADLDYHPNAHARGLRGMKTDTLGVVFPVVVETPFEEDYFGPIMAGIIGVATRQKMATLLFTAFEWSDSDHVATKVCDGRCDGYIVVGPPRKSQLVCGLIEKKVQFVVVGTHVEGVDVDTVDVDNVRGGIVAVQHLVSLGHTRIAIGAGWDQRTCWRERLEGYHAGLKQAGLPVDESLIMVDPQFNGIEQWDEIEQVDLLRRLLSDPKRRPTAIFCVQDPMAELAIQVAAEFGLRVPEDLSLVGFDDIPRASKYSPPLTTIRQPSRSIGMRAAELLCDRITQPLAQPENVLFEVELVERGSTAPPRPGH
jgi:LacI family transcriptional regulator